MLVVNHTIFRCLHFVLGSLISVSTINHTNSNNTTHKPGVFCGVAILNTNPTKTHKKKTETKRTPADGSGGSDHNRIVEHCDDNQQSYTVATAFAAQTGGAVEAEEGKMAECVVLRSHVDERDDYEDGRGD